MKRKKTKPWFQMDADHSQSALMKMLERADTLNFKRYTDLLCCARECNREGRLVSVIAGKEYPLDATMLSARIAGDTPEAYQAFLDLLIQLGSLTRAADGVLCLPDWEEWWGRLPKTGAERTQAWRDRQDPHDNEEDVDDNADADCGLLPIDDHRVTNSRHGPVTSVTKTGQNSALHNRTEQLHNTNTICSPCEQNRTGQESAGAAVLVSKEAHTFFPESLDEGQFWARIPVLFIEFVAPIKAALLGVEQVAFEPADARKLKKCLRESWAERHTDWAVRYLALRYGCRHLAVEWDRIKRELRAEPIDSPWGLALSMTSKYSDRSAGEMARMRAERAGGRDPAPPTFRKIPYPTAGSAQ